MLSQQITCSSGGGSLSATLRPSATPFTWPGAVTSRTIGYSWPRGKLVLDDYAGGPDAAKVGIRKQSRLVCVHQRSLHVGVMRVDVQMQAIIEANRAERRILRSSF